MKIATNEQLFEAIEAITHRLDHIEQLAVIGSKTILDLTEAAIFTGHSDYKAMKPYIDVADAAKADAMKLFNKK